ncbi:MAG: acyltransferase [Proteobacteria bacterium SG_bin9]|nr:MAG: acyltransferase [Proteobacteria bacterium SG_bin9]
MTSNGTFTFAPPPGRLDWVDTAKGVCIIMVVMMHSVLGVEAAAGQHGWMHPFVEFAKPFRMPDFFLISGLFLARVIDRDWRTYLDRKVVHFVYFYVLWMAIQFAFKAPAFAAEMGWSKVGLLFLQSFIEPFGTLWFIYLLPVFFVVTKLTRNIPPVIVWASAAALEMMHISSGWTVIDEFAARYVYFFSGYIFAEQIFSLADRVRAHPRLAMAGLVVWAAVNAVLVFAGIGEWPLFSLLLGYAGAIAIITAATLLTMVNWHNLLRYLGEHSIVVYLAFFLPMATTRTTLLKTGVIPDVGAMSLIVTLIGVFGAVAIWRAALAFRLGFLFERPAMFWIAPKQLTPKLQAAE